MKYKIAFFFSCFIFLSQSISAQNIKVSGKVTDENGAPLIGANIISTDSSNGVNGTVADFDGNYTIKTSAGSNLEITYVGYITQNIAVNGESTINVMLLPNQEALDEIVVTGYSKTKKANIIGAVATVKGSELMETGVTNMSQAIQDRLPGVYTEIPSGQPGADDAKITIRGVSTFNGDNSPLILIDGVEAAGGFSQLDPGEIASISVLKDAASTAVYGNRGADGVILITTNRGSEGPAKISVGGGVTAKTMSGRADKLSSYEVLMLGQEAIKNSGDYTGLRPQSYIDNFLDPNRDQMLYPDVDWYDTLIRDIGWENNARINVSGGTSFVKYFSSFSVNHVGDILKTEKSDNGYYDPSFSYDKMNFRTNLDFNLSKTTQLTVDISGRSETRKTPNTDVGSNDFGNIFKFLDEATAYSYPVYYTEEFVAAHPDPLSPYPASIRYSGADKENPYQSNPYTKLNTSGMRKYRKDVVDIRIGLTQKLDVITKGLSFSGKYNYSTAFDYTKTEGLNTQYWLYDVLAKEWRPQSDQNYNSSQGLFHSSGGESYSDALRNTFYQGQLDYSRGFNGHNVSALAVFNRTERNTGAGGLPSYSEDWAGQVNYDYKGKYLMKLTAGYNGSEKFAPGKRFGFFPGYAVGWNIAKEKIMQDNLPWLNTLKVRYNYGESGTENAARFLYLGGYASKGDKFSHAVFGLPAGSAGSRWAETKIGNPEATWETATKHNLGFDIDLFNYELTFGLNLYKEHRENIFVNIPVPSYYHPSFGSLSGGSITLPKVNLGEVKNHGFEVETNYKHTTVNGLRYSIGGSVTVADSRVIYQGDKVGTPDYQKNAGKPIGWLQGYQSNGYINTFEEAINSPEIAKGNRPGLYSYADFNGDGVINSNDNVVLDGTSQPQFIYAFNGSLSYKGFDLSARFFGKEGVIYKESSLFPNFNTSLLEGKTAHLDTWSPDNQNAAFPAFGNTSNSQGYQARSSATTINSSYLKLQSLSLGYSIKSELLKRALRIQTMRLNLSGYNLYSWSKAPFGDPEGGNGTSGGYGQYPLVKRFIFGVNIDF
ncbi:SusC/RagA family TonB-linked outer membrane protein [Mariniflexile sp. AS56]|uniref:SusC/RagA family TonB-linked outer membrane protein n=1 Tax=Mariniflexile sp. AS56 TaxID=3063957 RepID=UPI0026EC0125|nr:TonB-dependent receptor [Mariniflexile sp. AS56]MDO7172504.1 TonB-dependent receptor [Mariniflexile sp. AS56]